MMYISVRECKVALLRFKGAYRLNFELNSIQWQIVWVDNKNSLLSRTDGSMSVGVTDMNTHCIDQLEQHRAGRQNDRSWNYLTLFDLADQEAINEYNKMWDQVANWP